MNFSKFSVLLSLYLFSMVAVCFAKDDEKKAETSKDKVTKEVNAEAKSKNGSVKDSSAAVTTDSEASKDPLADAVAEMGSEGGSDFDIGKLLELIEALKNQNYDDVDKVLKDGPLDEINIDDKADQKNSAKDSKIDSKDAKIDSKDAKIDSKVSDSKNDSKNDSKKESKEFKNEPKDTKKDAENAKKDYKDSKKDAKSDKKTSSTDKNEKDEL